MPSPTSTAASSDPGASGVPGPPGPPRWRRALGALGTLAVLLAMLGGGALVLWNVFGQARYGGACRFSLGCRSFYCVHHALDGEAQVATDGGFCTQACERDDACGPGARCVVLGAGARADLPPFGKPTRACLPVARPPAPAGAPR